MCWGIGALNTQPYLSGHPLSPTSKAAKPEIISKESSPLCFSYLPSQSLIHVLIFVKHLDLYLEHSKCLVLAIIMILLTQCACFSSSFLLNTGFPKRFLSRGFYFIFHTPAQWSYHLIQCYLTLFHRQLLILQFKSQLLGHWSASPSCRRSLPHTLTQDSSLVRFLFLISVHGYIIFLQGLKHHNHLWICHLPDANQLSCHIDSVSEVQLTYFFCSFLFPVPLPQFSSSWKVVGLVQ